MLLICKCLNITIEIKGLEGKNVDFGSLSLSQLEKSDGFFQEDLREVELVGITNQVNSLVQNRTVGVWVIERCLNCSMDCYGKRIKFNNGHSGESITLINLMLISKIDFINELKNHRDFSPVFRIVIKPLPDTKSPRVATTQRMNEAISLLQKQLGHAVQEQITKTEERIQAFAEQERNRLKEFRERANRDHRQLLQILMSSQESFGSEIFSSNEISPERKIASDNSVTSHNRRMLTRSRTEVQPVTSSPRRETRTMPSRSLSLFAGNTNNEVASFDSEGLFALEGMEGLEDAGANEPNQSEGESDTDHDDSGSHDEGIDVHRKKESVVQIAKSLPVNVPVLSNMNADFERDDEPLDAVDIAASIKALARSVHGDAVFGDLPRPRFSTQI